MGARKSPPGQEETTAKTRRFLTAAEYFLCNRSFSECHSYALRALESDPTHPGPTGILTIAAVLSAPNITPSLPDYYTIFNLPHFESNAARIMSSFKTLISVLNPDVNPYPSSSEAFEVVIKGWSVLSNPLEKVRFDEELRRNWGSCASGTNVGTFWTVCPYCYHVYEYDRVFEECCLRCQNKSCRRGFHAVKIGAPPSEVVEKGHYSCPGFMPLNSSKNNEENFWVPFRPTSERYDFKGNCNGEGIFEISDDEVAGTCETEKVKYNKIQDRGNGSQLIIRGEVSTDEFMCETMDADAEKLQNNDGNNSGYKDTVLKGAGLRRKSVARNSKMSMGRRYEIDRNMAYSIHGVCEEEPLHVDGNEDLEPGFVGETTTDVENGVEFYAGDDDVLVGIQYDFDLGSKENM